MANNSKTTETRKECTEQSLHKYVLALPLVYVGLLSCTSPYFVSVAVSFFKLLYLQLIEENNRQEAIKISTSN